MAAVPALTIAVGLMDATICAGASRSVASAVAASLFRTASSPSCASDVEVEAETCERLRAIAPVIRTKVEAGAQGVKPTIPGSVRAQRNIAKHDGFGNGAKSLPVSGTEAKRRQRAGRRAKPGEKLLDGKCQRSEAGVQRHDLSISEHGARDPAAFIEHSKTKITFRLRPNFASAARTTSTCR